jgi:hypothetical protein
MTIPAGHYWYHLTQTWDAGSYIAANDMYEWHTLNQHGKCGRGGAVTSLKSRVTLLACRCVFLPATVTSGTLSNHHHVQVKARSDRWPYHISHRNFVVNGSLERAQKGNASTPGAAKGEDRDAKPSPARAVTASVSEAAVIMHDQVKT